MSNPAPVLNFKVHSSVDDLTCTVAPSDDDLHAYAEFFARELGFDHVQAIFHPATWYWEQIGTDGCTWAQACQIRELTIARCRVVRALHMGLAGPLRKLSFFESLPGRVSADASSGRPLAAFAFASIAVLIGLAAAAVTI